MRRAGEKARHRVVGSPWSLSSVQGPQINKTQFDKILAFIKTGEEEGAVLEAGGRRHGDLGYFVQPTVFSGVEDTMRIAREEIFGPVQSILKFSSLEEVIQRCNDTEYGLAAGILTRQTEYLARKLKYIFKLFLYFNSCHFNFLAKYPAWSRDMDTGLRFSQGVAAGSVWINCYDHTIAHTPFGGFKQSGHGRELGPEGIREYTELKTVTIAISQKNS